MFNENDQNLDYSNFITSHELVKNVCRIDYITKMNRFITFYSINSYT